MFKILQKKGDMNDPEDDSIFLIFLAVNKWNPFSIHIVLSSNAVIPIAIDFILKTLFFLSLASKLKY